MSPDEEALRRDLQTPAFRIGERRGKWMLKGIYFPYALFFIAAPPRPNGPSGFLLRSECAGYSGIAPTSQLWHGGNDTALDPAQRPLNATGGTMIPFSTWNACLYHPIDRLARDHWPGQFAEKKWTPDKTITFLLETVHDLLLDREYSHAALPATALEVPAAFMEEHPVGAS